MHDKTRQDMMNKTREDKERQGMTRQDKTRHDNERQNKIMHGKTKQDNTRPTGRETD